MFDDFEFLGRIMCYNAAARSSSAAGSGLSTIESTKLNMAEVEPMLMAMEEIATVVKTGSRMAWLPDVRGTLPKSHGGI